MKISPMAANAGGTPGQTLNSVDVGRTASPMRLERARAIARGEKAPEVNLTNGQNQPESGNSQPDVRRLRMRTNFSTNRDDALPEPTQSADMSLSEQKNDISPVAAEQSSTLEATEPGAVEATQPLSPQFAALAKQKRAFQLEKAEFEKQKAAMSTGINPEDFAARLKADPLGVLQEHGVTYDALTEAILSDKQQLNPEILALKQEIKALKEGVDKTFQSNEQRQEEAALTEMLYEAEALAKEGEDFEMIRTEDAYDEVLRLIHKTYKDTGRVLDVREAMNTIETKLFARAEKLASINKVRAKIAPPSPQPAQPAQRGMRTLTARDTASPVMDRRARAIAAAMGTLKR